MEWDKKEENGMGMNIGSDKMGREGDETERGW